VNKESYIFYFSGISKFACADASYKCPGFMLRLYSSCCYFSSDAFLDRVISSSVSNNYS